MPLVSVYMPAYNTENYIAEAIESLLGQSFTDFEFIIADDGSEDKTAAIVAEYAAADQRVRLIRFAEHESQLRTRSAAFVATKGEFVACMDSDDISSRDRLLKQVRYLKENPEVGAVGVHCQVVDENLQPMYYREPPERHALILLDCFLGPQDASFVHASLMMRRSLVVEVGGYDEKTPYGMDYDLMTRMLGLTKFANIPERLYIHRRRPGQVSGDSKWRENPKRMAGYNFVSRRRLDRILPGEPLSTMHRFSRVRRWSKLSWADRRGVKRDVTRLIDSMIAAEWIEPADRPELIAVLNERLEYVSPGLWQKFCHWRRHRFGS